MIENTRTGEQVEFEVRTPARLVMISTWTRVGQRVLEHLHPEMEESCEILEGVAAFKIRGIESVARPGDRVVVPPATPHLAWNPTAQVARLPQEYGREVRLVAAGSPD